VETVIEYTHRLMSVLSLLLVGGLVYRAFRIFPEGHRVRRFAALSGIFLALEALLGAGLVLFDYVAHNASAGRAVYMSAHLANTLILLGVIALTAWSSRETLPPLTLLGKPGILLAALPAAMVLCITGALAALGDTLFPAGTVLAGVQQELSRSASGLLRLRMIHPPVGLSVGAFLWMVALRAIKYRPTPPVRYHAVALMALVLVQLIAGAVNIALLAPVWMQLVHLFLAGMIWITLVMLLALALSDRLTLREQVLRED
jgi:heme A synthase